jgi:hypothetical protein
MTPISERTPHHAVQLYSDENDLFRTTARFLAKGLLASHPALVVATSAHRTAILNRLRMRGIDVDAAQDSFNLVVLDAGETLARVAVGGLPDWNEFATSVGELVTDILKLRGSTVLYAYSEMADLLRRDGKTKGAAELEKMWSRLEEQQGVALLHGYATDHFSDEAPDSGDQALSRHRPFWRQVPGGR